MTLYIIKDTYLYFIQRLNIPTNGAGTAKPIYYVVQISMFVIQIEMYLTVTKNISINGEISIDSLRFIGFQFAIVKIFYS